MLKNKMSQPPLTMPAREIIIFHHAYARDLFILHPVPDDHPVVGEGWVMIRAAESESESESESVGVGTFGRSRSRSH